MERNSHEENTDGNRQATGPSMQQRWKRWRHSARFHNLLLFLVFVGIASLFWVIIAMNDKAQVGLDVRISIVNKPDSLEFINLAPEQIHVTVSDKGTQLFRSSLMRDPVVEFNFKEYASDGVFRLTTSELYSALRERFGATSQINSCSIDSLHLVYTDLPGKRVPIDVIADLKAANGYVVNPKLTMEKSFVTVYSTKENILDTIRKVRTVPVQRSNLSETTTLTVSLASLKGVRVVPASIKIRIDVQPLVQHTVTVDVKAVNVPEGENILLFPSVVDVTGFVPMDAFNSDGHDFVLEVDYHDIKPGTRRLPVKLAKVPPNMVNPKIKPEWIEYTLVR